MQIENEARLSFYKEIADVNSNHAVKLVQHTVSQKIYVMKTLTVYDTHVFEYLKAHPLPGIPRIEELIRQDDNLIVIEEYVTGNTLRDHLDTAGSYTENEAAEIIKQLCEILIPLHNLTPPIVHRDLKPENLMSTSDNHLMLVDFNAAKECKQNQTKDTVLIGTAGYASPEQYGFSSSAPTSDIYAIGVLFNELLTGCMPTERINSGMYEPIIRKCLQMDPVNRYQNADELLQALKGGKKTAHPFLAKIRSCLPPGLGNKHPLIVAVSLLWYVFFVTMSFNIDVKGATESTVIINRVVFFLLCLLETLWIGNYRKIQNHLPLAKNRKLWIRIAGVILWGAVIFCALMILLTILTNK